MSLTIIITPPWWNTTWLRALCAAGLLALLWAAYQLRVRQLRHQFAITLDARVSERTRIARDLHDTLLQSAHGLLLRFQTVSFLPERPLEAKQKLDSAIDQTADLITEARDEVQGLRDSSVRGNDLALAISTLGEQLATDSISETCITCGSQGCGAGSAPHPSRRGLQDCCRIAAECVSTCPGTAG